MSYKEEIDDVCMTCTHYKYTAARMYLSNGDPGYPEENDCDFDWECPYNDDDEEADDELD
jgi:hypothetical protein